DKFSVMGLTTAAVISVVAGIGMTAEIGYYSLALSVSVITVVVLSIFHKVEKGMERLFLTRTIYVGFQDMDTGNLEKLKQVMDEHRIRYTRKTVAKRSRKLSVVFELMADRRNLSEFNNAMMELPYVDEFH